MLPNVQRLGREQPEDSTEAAMIPLGGIAGKCGIGSMCINTSQFGWKGSH